MQYNPSIIEHARLEELDEEPMLTNGEVYYTII